MEVCSGSSEPFAPSASNMVYTQRNSSAAAAAACDAYSSACSQRLIIKQRQRQTASVALSIAPPPLPPHLWVTSACCMTATPPLPPHSLVPHFSTPHPPRYLQLLLLLSSLPAWSSTPTPTTLFFCRHGLLLFSSPSNSVPLFSLSFPPSCEIAVVSYGFLFLRDGRWAHVGVEATKHAASCIHARLPADSTAATAPLRSRPLALSRLCTLVKF